MQLQTSAWDKAGRPLKTSVTGSETVAEQADKWLPYLIEADNHAGRGLTLITVERFGFLAKVDDELLAPSGTIDEL